MIRTFWTLIFTSFVVVCASSISFARWATQEDFAFTIEDHTEIYKINRDGSFKITSEGKYKILKDSARSSIGTMRWNYNAAISTFKIIEGETINDGHSTPLDLKYVQDKPSAAQEQGFDSNNQVVCSFPDVHLNSLVRVKFEQNIKKVPYHNFFSQKLFYGGSFYLKMSTDILLSELPLFLEVNDPDHILDIKEERESDLYKVSIKQKSPGTKMAIDEDKPLLDSKKLVWVVVSTSKSYSADVLSGVIDKYEKILAEPLPPKFENILTNAKQKTSTTEQIDTVTSELASIMRYMGDWRAIDGGHVPRDLSTINDTLFGDCKDFATVTTAILRRLGLDAHVAFVERGKTPTPLPNLPLDSEFNHAIVHIKMGDKILWIDPTNLASFASGIFEDIIDRQALVLTKVNPHLESIPKAKPEDSVKELVTDVNDTSEDRQDVNVKLRSFGRINTSFAGATLTMSRQSMDTLILSANTNLANVLESKVEYDDLSSRIVKAEVDFNVWFREKSTPMKTTMGLGKSLSSPDIIKGLMHLNIKDRVSGYFLEQPSVSKSKVHWRSISLLGEKIKECKIDSPWISVERRAEKINKGFTYVDNIISKQSFISSQDLQSKEFSRLQTDLKGCFEERYVIFRLTTPQASKRLLSSVRDEQE